MQTKKNIKGCGSITVNAEAVVVKKAIIKPLPRKLYKRRLWGKELPMVRFHGALFSISDGLSSSGTSIGKSIQQVSLSIDNLAKYRECDDDVDTPPPVENEHCKINREIIDQIVTACRTNTNLSTYQQTDSFEGFSESILRRLEKTGIKTVRGFLENVILSREQRRKICRYVDLNEDLIEKWIHQFDFFRLNNVAHTRAKDLLDCGVCTMADLQKIQTDSGEFKELKAKLHKKNSWFESFEKYIEEARDFHLLDLSVHCDLSDIEAPIKEIIFDHVSQDDNYVK